MRIGGRPCVDIPFVDTRRTRFEMDSTQDEDMYLFQSGFGETPTPFPTQGFDDFLVNSPTGKTPVVASPVFLNPNELSIKRESQEEQTIRLDSMAARTQRSPPSSDGSTRSSSSDDTKFHNRNISSTSGISPAATQRGDHSLWQTSGIGGLSMPSGEGMFADASMDGLENDFSNEQMASDFDFETAASTPSGFDAASIQQNKSAPSMQVFNRANFDAVGQRNGLPHRMPTAQPQFYFGASRDASPLTAMLPTAQGQSPWSKNSPSSSGLEETFNGITMNGDSPSHATFNPAQFSTAGFSFDPDSSETPSTFNKGSISSPPSSMNSTEGNPRLTVYPTSLKSRVETQIPIRMTLSHLPTGVTKLRLPTHTVSKPKFLARPEVDRNPEILELLVSLVCTSAMQDNVRLDRAFARARGEELGPLGRPSPASSTGSHGSMDDDDKPLNGGEVRICSGCVQRERKRASRKKQKKPDEEEQFQRDEEKRIVVFNTNEIKEWVEPSRDAPNGSASPPPGAVQVELPMRIACYCRHQNEKLGFQVIFTIKDCRDKVIAQAMTNSIMITDDHKTHNAPPPPQQMPAALPNAPVFPGAGVFASGMESSGNALQNGKFKTSYSTTDLHGLQPNFNASFPMTPSSNPFAIPSAISSNTSATMTPRNLSRPASPSGPSGPTTKRRKQSGSGKIPSLLTMTRLETTNASGSSTVPNSAASTPYPNQMQSFVGPADHGYALPAHNGQPRQQIYDASPPTPNSNDNGFVSGMNRSFSLENMGRPALISAPSSRQPSRPSSPGIGSTRNSFGTTDPSFAQSVTNQLMGQPSRRPPPLIHKLVPAEGSVTGGTEVTLLGNGFYQGLEVMFGDTEATTTTFWGEKCLNCIAPPALQPGIVTVMFKHEHHQYTQMQQQSQSRQSIFKYIDDREVEMYRLALKTLGKTMQHPTDDPYSAAQQLLGSQHGNQPWYWSSQGNYVGHQRQMAGPQTDTTDLLDLETNMLHMLRFMDTTGSSKSSLLDICRPTGSTLLHLASSLGLTRFVAGLLARGARPDLVDRGGNTPMHHAAMNGHTHIIHRLRLAGADNKIRSIRNYIPADLATSLLAHQAAMIPSQHYRSRSVGGTPIRLHSRNASSTSLKSFWEHASTATAYSDDTDSSDDEGPQVVSHVGLLRQTEAPRSTRPSRRPSGVLLTKAIGDIGEAGAGDKPVTPLAYMVAWRDSLAAQINQFQESAQRTLPNLPTLPTLPPIPDYQEYSMVRRVSSLFPQRPTSRPPSGSVSKEGWWETLTGSPNSSAPSAPPAYNELFPHTEETDEDYSIKKRGTLLAAAEAAADLHLSHQEVIAGSSTRVESVRMYDGKPIKRVELKQDRKLFFFWVCLISSPFRATLTRLPVACAHHRSWAYAQKYCS